MGLLPHQWKNPETLGHSCFNMNRRKEKRNEYFSPVWRFQNNELTLQKKSTKDNYVDTQRLHKEIDGL